MICPRCKKNTATNEFRLPFQPNNDLICEQCWVELKEFYAFWKLGSNLAGVDEKVRTTIHEAKRQVDHAATQIAEARAETEAATKKGQMYHDMYAQLWTETHPDTTDDMDRYRYKNLYHGLLTRANELEQIIEQQQKSIQDQSSRINDFQIQELDLTRGFKEVRRKNKEKKLVIKNLRAAVIQLQELDRHTKTTYSHRLTNATKHLTEKVKLLEAELAARPYQDGNHRIQALTDMLIEAEAKIEGRDLNLKTSEVNHKQVVAILNADIANLTRVEKDTARKLAACKAQCQQYATNYAELRQTTQVGDLLLQRDNDLKKAREEAKHYEEVAQKLQNQYNECLAELQPLKINNAQTVLNLGAMTQDRDIIKGRCEFLERQLSNTSKSEQEYRDEVVKLTKELEELQKTNKELAEDNARLYKEVGSTRSLQEKLNTSEAANEKLIKDLAKMLSKSLTWNKRIDELLETLKVRTRERDTWKKDYEELVESDNIAIVEKDNALGLSLARDVWRQKYKELTESVKTIQEEIEYRRKRESEIAKERDEAVHSLAYEKDSRDAERKQLNDVTADRDTVLARLQAAEKTLEMAEKTRLHLTGIIDWINNEK